MTSSVKPTGGLRGSVTLPASKSYSIRAFLIAACGGVSRIISPSDCDDALVAMSVAQRLGARIIPQPRETFLVKAGKPSPKLSLINVGESGTVLRFLLPLLPLNFRRAKVIGRGTLRGRPNQQLIQVLRAQGVAIRGRGPQETIPIIFSGGTLKGGPIQVDGTLSSQFISALLIACPQILEDTRLDLKGRRLASADYIEMTRRVLARSGVKSKKISTRRFLIPGSQVFKGLQDFHVPSDYGLAAFLMAASALLPSQVTLRGHFNKALPQADGVILNFLKRMGVKFSASSQAIKMRGPFELKGGDFSLQSCPDLVPVMAALALFAKGRTRLLNVGHARVKESDRISDLAFELKKLGARIEENQDGLTVYPGKSYRSFELLDAHHDHRLAMAFTVLGLKIGVRIKDLACVSKSYPGFVRDMKSLGADFEI